LLKQDSLGWAALEIAKPAKVKGGSFLNNNFIISEKRKTLNQSYGGHYQQRQRGKIV
jgi:hypothetical protein